MIFKNEKQILKIIKYTPTVFIILISTIIMTIQFIEKNNTFEKEKSKLTSEFLQNNKQIIKDRVYEAYTYIEKEKKRTEEDLKDSLQLAINNAYSIANTIYENNKDKDQELIKKLIIDALRNIRFNNGRGYYFVYENNGKNLLLPHNKELEGKNFWNHKDSKGTYIVQKMVNLLSKNEQAFCEWYWYNPIKKDIQRKKIGLVKNFTPFNWFIGTGEYLEDYENEIKENVLKHIRDIRFGKNGYIFVITYDGIYLSHIRKNFIGKDALTNNDTENITNVINDIKNIAQNGEGYYTYIQNEKPNTNKKIDKTSFVKGLNEWSWIIGTGFYEDDLEKAIKDKEMELNNQFRKNMITTIEIVIVLIIFLLICSVYFSKLLQTKFKRYKNEIRQHLIKNTTQQNIMAQQSKMAAMGEMIANIAHQWRQPLSTISTTSTGMKLQKEMNILEDKFLLDGLKSINDSAQYLSHTIDDFRNFFKVTKNKTLFSTKDLFKKALNLIHTQFHNIDIKLIIDIDDIKIKNYENEFIQVIINILNNARDELVKKSKEEEKLIFLSCKELKNSVIIEIKDNAGGIPEDIIDRIFEPYFTTKHKNQGTGIGLYMSREIIIKNMLGKIKVLNTSYTYNEKIYEGALFEIILPLK